MGPLGGRSGRGDPTAAGPVTALLAAAPVFAVVLAIGLRASSRTAALSGLAVAAVVTAIGFPVSWRTLAAAGWEWAPTGVEVMLILAGGICFAEAGRATGIQDTISRWVQRAFGTGVAPVLGIVHGLTPLTESVTGYGVGAAIAVPLILALGVPGPRAAAVSLCGLCTVPWGSMGPGTLIGAQLGGVTLDEIGVASALFTLPVTIATGIGAALLVAAPEGRWCAALAGAGSGTLLAAGILAANLAVGTPPAGALGAVLTLGVHAAIRRLRARATTAGSGAVGGAGGPERTAGEPGELSRAAVPYGVVLGGMLVAHTVFRLAPSVPAGVRGVLGSPAWWLACAIAVIFLTRDADRREILRGAGRMWARVAPPTAVFLLLGILMSTAGMSQAIAGALAALGTPVVLALPFLAGFSGFITGSNTGANALAAASQGEVARALALDAPLVMGAHNAAASVAVMSAPARVELAAQLARVPAARTRIQLFAWGTALAACAGIAGMSAALTGAGLM